MRWALVAVLAWLLAVAVGLGCSEEDDRGGADSAESSRPLKPLVYTERPELSPEAAAVRERRLMRKLLEGSVNRGTWGSLESQDESDRPPLTDADQLAEAIFETLVERDEAAWDRLFVAPEEYASFVGVELDRARKYVDDIQAQSGEVWDSFAPEPPSEAREGGFEGLFEVAGLELGSSHALDGEQVEADQATHFVDNTLELRLVDTDVAFELDVSTIVRLQAPDDGPGASTLAVGGAIEMDPKFEVYLRAGLHLKEQLLEPREYPYPLAVGSFWRYRRLPAEQRDGRLVPSDDPGDADIGAFETLREVTDVDRYGTSMVVGLRHTYEDEDLTTLDYEWIVTPRRIYYCDEECAENPDDIDSLLEYLADQTPIYRFPLRLEEGWSRGGKASDTEAIFRVAADWRDVEAPAGTFTNTVLVEGRGPLGAIDPYLGGRSQRRFFAHGRGLVRRELGGDGSVEGAPVIEELIESRIMPR